MHVKPAGQYPILGRRFQCQDCPDAMGFDLCGGAPAVHALHAAFAQPPPASSSPACSRRVLTSRLSSTRHLRAPACYDRGLSDLVGRFNQRHTPVHSMRLMRPRVTAMHLLQVRGRGAHVGWGGALPCPGWRARSQRCTLPAPRPS